MVTSQRGYLMQPAGWFLPPPNYIMIPLSKNAGLEKGFNDI